jgi:hypothetical protein
MTMMRFYTRFRDLGMHSRVFMTIHDVVDVEAPADESDEAKNQMETQWKSPSKCPWRF